MVEGGCWFLSEGFSGLRPSWCRQVSKMENWMLDLPLCLCHGLPWGSWRVKCRLSS